MKYPDPHRPEHFFVDDQLELVHPRFPCNTARVVVETHEGYYIIRHPLATMPIKVYRGLAHKMYRLSEPRRPATAKE